MALGGGDGAGPDNAAVAGRFGRLLHGAGVPVTVERSGRLAAVMTVAPPLTVDQMYWMGRVTLLSEQAQIATYDRLFAQVFGGMVDEADWRGQKPAPPASADRARSPGATPPADGPTGDPGSTPTPSAGGDGDSEHEGPERESILVALSAEEHLRTTDFALLDPEELARLRAVMARLALVTPQRRGRRTQRGRGPEVDLRSTLARARHTAGEPLALVRRRYRPRRRLLVLLCDISGSMEPYARAYLQLVISAVGGTRAEAFVFATRLTRVTRALRAANPDVALRQAADAAPDWSGGTRIGDAIGAFIDGYGRRGMARGAVVVILSDGWERDDPALLGRQMARLSRLAHRIVWVNPRRAAERYQPFAGGMAAALPYVDRFVAGHSLHALDEVLDAIGGTDHGAQPRRSRRRP